MPRWRRRERKPGLSRIYCLSLGDAPVGYVFALTHAGRLYYLLIGCDYAAYGRHSPGLLLYDLMMEQWVAEGGEVFDFTIGDEAFKADFGTTATVMHALVATPTLAGKTGLAIFDARGRVRRMAAGLRGRTFGGGGDK
ncbi:MAG: GNAT family N-acetyltransferase [Pseudaminobacter sp.]|nr:GNAT family N-acetyltransferase [Pseudaminobacter sp.]